MSDKKVYPTHRISFSEVNPDARKGEQVGKPIDVATIWPRKEGKNGGIIEWHIHPSKLGEGVYFHLENERQQTTEAHQSDGFDRIDQKESGRDQGVER